MLLAQCLLARMLQRHGLPLPRTESRKAGVAAAHSFVILDGDRMIIRGPACEFAHRQFCSRWHLQQQ